MQQLTAAAAQISSGYMAMASTVLQRWPPAMQWTAQLTHACSQAMHADTMANDRNLESTPQTEQIPDRASSAPKASSTLTHAATFTAKTPCHTQARPDSILLNSNDKPYLLQVPKLVLAPSSGPRTHARWPSLNISQRHPTAIGMPPPSAAGGMLLHPNGQQIVGSGGRGGSYAVQWYRASWCGSGQTASLFSTHLVPPPAPFGCKSNEDIKAEILVVFRRNKLPMEMPLSEARAAAAEAGIDLVQLECSISPPIALVVSLASLKDNPAYAMDRLKIRSKADRVKELRFSCKTAVNDVDLKLRNLRRMLDDGDRVSIVLEFKAGKEDEEAHKRMDEVLASLREGAAGQPGKVLSPSKGVLSVVVSPREGRGGPMAGYVEAAEAALLRMCDNFGGRVHSGGQGRHGDGARSGAGGQQDRGAAGGGGS